MPKHVFQSFPVEIAHLLATLCRPLYASGYRAKLDRKDLLVRLKGCEHVSQLPYQRVLAIWARAKRSKDSVERRPVVTLMRLAPGEEAESTASKAEFLDFLVDAMQSREGGKHAKLDR